MQTKSSIAFLAVLLALAGCDGSPPADPDAGPAPETDSGPTSTPDSGPPPAEGCDAARAVALTAGEQTITGNTTGMSTAIDLGEECGYEPAPQEILALTVPGTGPKTVLFDLAVGTTAFDTIVQVRPSACESLTGAACFDDINLPGEEYRSAGHFEAEGGSTVHLIVTGYAIPDEPAEQGRWTMAVDVRESAPTLTLTAGEAKRFGAERYELLVDGADSDGDVIGVLASFLDATGAPISFMGFPALDWDFDISHEGETTFEDALITIDFPDFVSATAAATQVQIALFDRFGYMTDPMTFPIRNVTIVGRGEACNADALCRTELECIADTCQVPPAVVTACTAASALTFTDGAASAPGSLEPGTGHLDPSCANGTTPHAEDLYTVEVPAGAFDLIASTDNTATGAADTAVFIQSTCGDSETEVACHDDVDFAGGNARSIAVIQDVAAGTYTIAVEIVGTHDAATAYELDVRLRPVIGEGVSCDPMQIMNRCSTGACPTGDTPVCPAAPPPAP